MNKYLLIALAFVPFYYAHSDENKMMSDKAYYNDNARGWYWYEKPAVKKKKEKKPEPVIASSGGNSSPSQMSARDILKKQGENWENAAAEAALNPTPENLQRYMMLTMAVNAQSERFATSLKNSLRLNPQFDYTIEHPVNPQAIIAKNEQRNEISDSKLKFVAKESGIIFFFRSDCPYCHRFAPIMKTFASMYGFDVIPVSLDGGGLPEYPNPQKNVDMGRKLNVSTVPAVFLVNPSKNIVSTVGYGFVDYAELQHRVISADTQMNSNSINTASREK